MTTLVRVLPQLPPSSENLATCAKTIREDSVHHLKTQLFAALTLLLLCTGAAAQDSLKTIDNPSGGQIVYGPTAGQTSMQGAMGSPASRYPQPLRRASTDRQVLPDRGHRLRGNLFHSDGKESGRKAHRRHGHRFHAWRNPTNRCVHLRRCTTLRHYCQSHVEKAKRSLAPGFRETSRAIVVRNGASCLRPTPATDTFS